MTLATVSMVNGREIHHFGSACTLTTPTDLFFEKLELGLPTDEKLTPKMIKDAYRTKSKVCHPDKTKGSFENPLCDFNTLEKSKVDLLSVTPDESGYWNQKYHYRFPDEIASYESSLPLGCYDIRVAESKELTKHFGDSLNEDTPPSLKNDRFYVKNSIIDMSKGRVNARKLSYASDALQNKRDFILELAKLSEGKILPYAKYFNEDETFLLDVLKATDGKAIVHIDSKIKKDPTFIEKAQMVTEGDVIDYLVEEKNLFEQVFSLFVNNLDAAFIGIGLGYVIDAYLFKKEDLKKEIAEKDNVPSDDFNFFKAPKAKGEAFAEKLESILNSRAC